MDIDRMKKLIESEIEAGKKTKEVREAIKSHVNEKDVMYRKTKEMLEPSFDFQENIEKDRKKEKDERQDKLIEQLQENQKALAERMGKFAEANLRAITCTFEEEIPKAIEGPVESKRELSILDVDNNFSKTDKIILNNYKLLKPKDLTQMPPQKLSEERNKAAEIAQAIGRKKGQKKTSNEDKKSYDIELQTQKKYRGTITDLLASFKYISHTGEGIYTQKKRNAYKISQKGQYGGLVIDLPKLYGHLKVVAHKNGQKVYDKQADFDTLDLLTKRFNSRKKYSELARSNTNT